MWNEPSHALRREVGRADAAAVGVTALRADAPATEEGLPPGPRGVPILGNALDLRRDELRYLLDLQRRYGRMATIHIGRTPVVLLFRPEHVHYVLVERPASFTSREVAGGLIFGNLLVLSLLSRSAAGSAVQGLRDIVGDGLLTTDGAYHDRHRLLVRPAFARSRVESQAGTIVQYTQDALARWPTAEEMEITAELQALVLRTTMKMLVNVDVLTEDGELGRLIQGMLASPIGLLEGLLNLRVDVPFLPHGRRVRYKRRADRYIDRCIEQRLAHPEDAGDVLSMLLAGAAEPDSALTKREIRDELINLAAAGHETSANTLAWTLYLLARHPAVLERVLAELEHVLEGRAPEVADLPRLAYLDCAIKESMRLYPAAWTQGRRAVAPFELDGYRFPAGTLLMFSQWVIHRLPEIWEDPEAYRPERWAPATRMTLPPGAYFPFGAGSRICLGKRLAEMQIRLVLATVLQRCIPRPVPRHPVVPLPLVTLRLRHGLRLRWHRNPTPAAWQRVAATGSALTPIAD